MVKRFESSSLLQEMSPLPLCRACEITRISTTYPLVDDGPLQEKELNHGVISRREKGKLIDIMALS